MPKLLNVNSYHYRRGGADVVYLDHAALLEANGWANAFFAMHHPLNEATPWSKYFVDELQYGSSYGVLQKIRMAGKVVYSLEARKKIDRLIRDFRPDVAHAHNLYHHLSPSVLCGAQGAWRAHRDDGSRLQAGLPIPRDAARRASLRALQGRPLCQLRYPSVHQGIGRAEHAGGY